MPANNVLYISLKVSGVEASDEENVPAVGLLKSFYPNPFRDQLKLMLSDSKGKTALKVYNLKGELVSSCSVSGDEASWNGKDLSGRDCPAGIYLIQVSDSKRSETIKVLKYR